ncbi:MAG: AbrB family transcriptional regulator [Gammaproteobacteria bacterium]|nr:AbrB family transcriptional regulator [Gammaproteobacteria bacterium]
MARLSTKRQITIPIDQCEIAGIKPGDDLDIFSVNKGQITFFKKSKGAAKGLLKDIKAKSKMSDEQSRQSAIKIR